MSAIIIDGAAIAKGIRERVTAEATRMAEAGVVPGLAVILVGDDRASHSYVRSKRRACKKAGIHSELQHLSEEDLQQTFFKNGVFQVRDLQDDLLARVAELNRREEIDGILVQLPLPDGVDTQMIVESIDPNKDVDGFHPMNFGKLTIGLDAFVPATPLGILEILRVHNIPIKGARAVIIGRSNIVGKPIALLLMHRHATVTICHSRTQDLAGVAREADILIAATGRAGLVTPEFVKAGAAVIDVGTNAVDDEKLVKELFGDDPSRLGDLKKKGYTIAGDVHPRVAETAGLLTPVPGGVGPLTITMLLANCVAAARNRRLGGS